MLPKLRLVTERVLPSSRERQMRRAGLRTAPNRAANSLHKITSSELIQLCFS